MRKGSSKERLLDTMERLLLKKPLSEITVEEILKEAGVSKPTFYRNFMDKYELANKILDRYMEPYIQQYEKDKNYRKFWMNGCRMIYEKRDLYRVLFRDAFEQNSFYFYILNKNMEILLSRIDKSKITDEMLLETYVYITGSTNVAWKLITGEMQMDFDKSVEHILSMTPSFLKPILQIE